MSDEGVLRQPFPQPCCLMRQQFLKTDDFRAFCLNFGEDHIPAEFPAVDAVAFRKAKLCLRTGLFDRTGRKLGDHLPELLVIHRLDIAADIKGDDFHKYYSCLSYKNGQLQYTAIVIFFQFLFIFCRI